MTVFGLGLLGGNYGKEYACKERGLISISRLGTSPGEGLMLKLKLQYFGHLMRRVDSLEKTLMMGGIGGRRSGVLQFMGLQRVGQD